MDRGQFAGSHPQGPRRIGQHAGESSGGSIQHAGTPDGADPKIALPVLDHGRDGPAARRRGVVRIVLVVGECAARGVQAVKPGVGADPEYTATILIDAMDPIVAQGQRIARVMAEVREGVPSGVEPVQPAKRRADREHSSSAAMDRAGAVVTDAADRLGRAGIA